MAGDAPYSSKIGCH